MPRYIVKTEHPDTGAALYAEWSTIVDAPVSGFMPLAAFKRHYRREYGASWMQELPTRLERAKKQGTSAMWTDLTFDDLIACNRAGENEEHLPKSELVRRYMES